MEVVSIARISVDQIRRRPHQTHADGRRQQQNIELTPIAGSRSTSIASRSRPPQIWQGFEDERQHVIPIMSPQRETEPPRVSWQKTLPESEAAPLRGDPAQRAFSTRSCQTISKTRMIPARTVRSISGKIARIMVKSMVPNTRHIQTGAGHYPRQIRRAGQSLAEMHLSKPWWPSVPGQFYPVR